MDDAVNSLPDGKYISYAADGDNRWKDGILNKIHGVYIRGAYVRRAS